MSLLSTMFVAFGVSMDAFAVSLANGANQKFNKILLSAFLFGLFQALQPLFGWMIGSHIHSYIIDFDHWVAFLLLVFIGSKMIYDALKRDDSTDSVFSNSLKCILILAFATSIDALVIGFTYSMLDISIVIPAVIIGVITLAMSLLGVSLGRKFGNLLGSRFSVVGGVLLCSIGVKILFDHIMI